MSEQTAESTKQKISPFTWVIIGALAALMALIGWGLANNSGERPQVGEPAPDVQLTFFEGYGWNNQSEAMLSDMQGNIVVLNIWGSWCAECKHEADDLENTYRAFADQGVVFLGVAYLDIDSNSLEFLSDYDITYPNVPDRANVINDTFQFTGVPETVIIDKDGNIAAWTIGPVKAEGLAAVIDQLLAES